MAHSSSNQNGNNRQGTSASEKALLQKLHLAETKVRTLEARVCSLEAELASLRPQPSEGSASVFHVENPQLQQTTRKTQSAELRSLLENAPETDDDWSERRKILRLSGAGEIMHTFLGFVTRTRSQVTSPCVAGSAPSNTPVDLLRDFKAFVENLSDDSTRITQLHHFGNLLLVSLCRIARFTGTPTEDVDNFMDNVLPTKRKRKRQSSYMKQLRFAVLWPIHQADLLRKRIQHRADEYFLLYGHPFSEYVSISGTDDCKDFANIVNLPPPPEEREVNADFSFSVPFIVQLIAGNMFSLKSVCAALNTELTQEQFDASVSAIWKHAWVLRSIPSPPVDTPRTRRRTIHTPSEENVSFRSIYNNPSTNLVVHDGQSLLSRLADVLPDPKAWDRFTIAPVDSDRTRTSFDSTLPRFLSPDGSSSTSPQESTGDDWGESAAQMLLDLGRFHAGAAHTQTVDNVPSPASRTGHIPTQRADAVPFPIQPSSRLLTEPHHIDLLAFHPGPARQLPRDTLTGTFDPSVFSDATLLPSRNNGGPQDQAYEVSMGHPDRMVIRNSLLGIPGQDSQRSGNWTYSPESTTTQKDVFQLSTLAVMPRLISQPQPVHIVPDIAPSIAFAIDGNIEGLKALFDEKLASPMDVSHSRRFSLLRWALYGGLNRQKTVAFLLQQGAHVDKESHDHVWDFSFRGKCTAEEHQALSDIRMSGHWDWIDEQNFRLVHRIILRLSSRPLATELEENAAAVKEKDIMGRTALDWATARAQLDDMRLLIAHGSDLNSMDSTGRTTVLHAVDSHNDQALSMILEAGAKPDPEIPARLRRSSPLTSASFGGLATMAKLLLRHGADIGQNNPEGRTPLTTAIIWNKHAVLTVFADWSKEHPISPPPLSLIAELASAETMLIVASFHFLNLSPGLSANDISAGRHALTLRRDYNDNLAHAFESVTTRLTAGRP